MNPKQMVENRSVQLIFRDCLKVAPRMVHDQHKVNAIRKLLRSQFQKNKNIFDQDEIYRLKMNAVRGISNYIIHTVQEQYKLNPKKIKNIMQEEDELQHRQ